MTYTAKDVFQIYLELDKIGIFDGWKWIDIRCECIGMIYTEVIFSFEDPEVNSDDYVYVKLTVNNPNFKQSNLRIENK